MLAEAGSTELSVFVFTPDYVREYADKGTFGQSTWLNYYDHLSDFSAIDNGRDDQFYLRGERRGVSTLRAELEKLVIPEVSLVERESRI